MPSTLKKFNVKAGLSVGSETIIDVIDSNGNATFNNISTSGFFVFPTYTASNLQAITGQAGWAAAVSDSSQGSNPNGMIAFWDTTNSRWSYVHDNSAV